jgi:hypothetical protein
MSNPRRHFRKIFDTAADQAHAEAEAAADAVCKPHDNGKADTLEHKRIPALGGTDNSRDKNISDGAQVLFYSQSGP